MLPHIHNEISVQHEFLMINSSQWPVKKQTKAQITNTKINLFKEKATTLYMFENYKMTIKIVLHAIIITFIGLFRFTILLSHNPQIAKASLGEQCLYKTKKALQMVIN